MTESLTSRYAPLTKQTGIINRLEATTVEEVREDDEDYYAALDKLTKRINEIAPRARIKDRE